MVMSERIYERRLPVRNKKRTNVVVLAPTLGHLANLEGSLPHIEGILVPPEAEEETAELVHRRRDLDRILAKLGLLDAHGLVEKVDGLVVVPAVANVLADLVRDARDLLGRHVRLGLKGLEILPVPIGYLTARRLGGDPVAEQIVLALLLE